MILNLAHPERSEIKYTITKFPDGQQDFRFDYPSRFQFDSSGYIKVLSRMNSWRDLEVLSCVTSALNNLKSWGKKSLIVPYILGARSDRKFVEGGSHYLRDVIAPFINSLEFNRVIVTDPHSDVVEAVIKNIKVRDNWDLVKFALESENPTDYSLIAPDAGSLKKIYKIQEKCQKQILLCSKHRDIKTGKILETVVPYQKFLENGQHLIGSPFIVVDDICDGGRTFIEIAKGLKKEHSLDPLVLVVTHGIFSKGLEELRQYFKKVYCTNSVSDLNDPLVSQMEVL